ncbi:hypothetical protein GUJ93_ZPchr0002g25537 [Zizania palustris]|uniref:Uncharacterized protein n=1 Tax=Zizania palustris TaxID=103762 RepID=A0A8J5VC38_ZIZPA|nr:hypothetical protein GUJ93_ZPchr0002g25537 [Zizania palustris]
MGLCFSKKRKEKPPACAETASSKEVKKSGKIDGVVAVDKGKMMPQSKKAVFAMKAKAEAVNVEEKKRPGEEARPVVLTTMPVRTSSCTKEEVDAILIQCGRLSRSSSGRAASSETGGSHRRSKRSHDFDQERRDGGGGGDEDRDWERQGGVVSRPSPHRGSPQRKRSGSRERSGGGSRRASRSPGRRTEGTSSAAPATSGGGGGERLRQQPGKMVSLPAREKGRTPSPAAASGKRCASPRSSSPARVAALGNENAGGGHATAGQTPSLSRSSSRKAEQSPYRRSPMAEIDGNSLCNNNGNPQKKSSENALSTAPQKATELAKEKKESSCCSAKEKPKIVEETVAVAPSETRAPSTKTTATRTASVVAESLNTKATVPGCRSRRASRDFDQNPNSYATQLLEDIQSYHQLQNTSVAATAATLPSFSLPACVSKACSILEAVADLNSSSSESRSIEPDRSANDKGSINASRGGMDDLAEPSVHKRYVSVRDIRGETEPQESAGSNSVSGQPWTPSWEPNSVESTDRSWSSSRSTNNGDEVVEQGSRGGAPTPLNRSRQSKQRTAQPDPSIRSRAGSSGGNNNSNVHRGRNAHRVGGGSVASDRSGVRAVSAIS